MEGKPIPELETEFSDMVNDPDVECIYKRGQWLVPVFAGVERRRRSSNSVATISQRKAAITGQEMYDNLERSGDQLLTKFRESMSETKTRAPTEVPPSPTSRSASRASTTSAQPSSAT